jgi:hypothetical protein
MKTSKFVLYEAEIAVCSEINIKYINTVWQIVTFFNDKPVGASRDQQALKG